MDEKEVKIRPELQKKIDAAILLLRTISEAYNGGVIEVAYSGGKDSDVILQLTREAGIPYRAIYKNTTIDPPGTIKHAEEMGVEVVRPKISFFELVAKRGFPSRTRRFCCKYLKEYKILDKVIIGVRREESQKRTKIYVEPTQCRVFKKEERVEQIMPILDWTILFLVLTIFYKQCAADELLKYQQPNVKLFVRDSQESKSLAKIEDKLRKLYDETELIEAGDILQNVIELRDYVEKRAEREAWEKALDYSVIPQKPYPQRNLQGEIIAKPEEQIKLDEICERATQLLRETDMYIFERDEERLHNVRNKACYLLNVVIAYRRQCKKAAAEYVEQVKKI